MVSHPSVPTWTIPNASFAGHIAKLIGMPSYSRHVGQALKFLSPDVAPPVPWHRVISSAGTISSRGPGTDGAQRQREALEAEGVEVAIGRTGERRVDLTTWGWFPQPGTIDIGVPPENAGDEVSVTLQKMPWNFIRLNSGYNIPGIAFGTWRLGSGQVAIDRVEQALDTGFSHIDTAQMYLNEHEAGAALRESGLQRSDVFITTKYSGTNGLDIATSIHESVSKLGVDYVDLYLIHFPNLAVPDIPTVWAQMEKIQEAGLARSIGVSNFNAKHLEILLASAKVKPAIQLHPYVYRQQLPVLEYAAANGIVVEAYSPLTPITRRPGGPLDKPLNEIAKRHGATNDQVLLAWVKAKGAVAVTSSSKRTRLQGYLAAGDIVLSEEDIAAIDAAGALEERRRNRLGEFITGLVLGAAVFAICSYFNVNILWDSAVAQH
ncbi:hypothetical protein ID866_6188 [Astraeus odoratus]|nr:hypothetical protein ID866_6188 [Astraeus odoratus]